MFTRFRKSPAQWNISKTHAAHLRHYARRQWICPRCYSIDERHRLSAFWTPTGGIQPTPQDKDDGLALLARSGFLRQAYSGIFHLLPLGLRVQGKIETLIDKHMRKLGASKLSLSSLSSESLWQRSGRLEGYGSELFRLDRKKGPAFLLSPTHEEEITELVGRSVQSYKELPLRVYQVSRKYRDERRPRGGLLRAREFLMKDLYTFDATREDALQTYNEVRSTYNDIFSDMKIPFLVAEADSGAMGGDLSHEYHFVSPLGEDNVINCDACSYVSNEEKVESRQQFDKPLNGNSTNFQVWTGITRDRRTLVNVYFPATGSGVLPNEINIHAVKAAVPLLDASVENPLDVWQAQSRDSSTKSPTESPQIMNVFDRNVRSQLPALIRGNGAGNLTPPYLSSIYQDGVVVHELIANAEDGHPLSLLRVRDGDPCPRCTEGSLKIQKAVEIGHTFYLGTRYSEPLDATVDNPAPTSTPGKVRTALQMGCHGIGVSRMIGAVASLLADKDGLNWPRVIAPFDVVLVPGKGLEDDASLIYDTLNGQSSTASLHSPDAPLEVIVDDRLNDLGWKLKDADLIGYPVVIVLGRAWRKEQSCEVQCRRLKVKTEVPVEQLLQFVHSLLSQL